MKKQISTVIFIAAMLLPINANAFFFGPMINGMTQVATAMVQGGTSVSNNAINAGANTASGMMNTMLELSDDIGTMSNRILTMADKIGDMADRIVKTEEMMFNFANGLPVNTSAPIATIQNETVLLTVANTYINFGELPNFRVHSENETILLLVSSSIFNENTTSVHLTSYSDYQKFWPLLRQAAVNNKLFIAVKTINGTKISPLSNSIELTLN